MELLVESNGVIYDMTGCCTKLSLSEPLNDGAGSLDFTYLYDGAEIIQNGSYVRLCNTSETDGVFFGRVFKTGMGQDKEVKVKAYDQLRYCKAKDTITIENETLTDLVTRMCNFFQLQTGSLMPTGYVLQAKPQCDKTWLDIIYGAVGDTLIGTERMYCLRDEYGSVCLRDIADLQLPLIIGDNSLCYEYDWEKSIDDEFYNQVKLVSGNKKTGHADVYITKDTGSIEKYGMLQYYEKLENDYDPAKAKAKADALLKLYNHEKETLTFKCMGDLSVRAGNSIYGSIEDIRLNRRLIVQKVTHDFLPVHTMTLEVMAG